MPIFSITNNLKFVVSEMDASLSIYLNFYPFLLFAY